jgi:hypothetical protein
MFMVWLVVAMCGIMICGEAMGNEAQSVALKVKRKATDSWGNAITLCSADTMYYTRVTWYANNSDDYLKNQAFDVEIWQPGEEDPGEEDGYPPPSGTNTEIEDWVEPANPDNSSFEQEIDIDEAVVPAVAFSIGSHEIRAWVHRQETEPLRAWDYSTAREVDILEITDVEWETYPDDVDEGTNDHGANIAIDSHPAVPANGGWRIFPGKKCYDDTTNEAAMRKKVNVKATINPALQGKTVYFKWFDVDDPIESTGPIDDNDSGGPTGGDNKGSGESLSAAWATTNASGEATVTFTVSMQPGDNFKIAAAVCQDHIDEVNQSDVDGGTLPGCVVMSEMLTVWRKLWIERDSMNAVATTGVEKDLTSSTITALDATSYNSGSGITTLDVDDLDNYWDGANRLNGGKLAVGGNEYTIVDMYNTTGDETLDVQGDPYGDGVGENDGCNLYDDDYSGSGIFQIVLPLRQALVGQDRLAYQRAYIDPVNLSSDYEDTVSFDLNFSSISDLTPDLTGSTSFWTVMVMNAFQPNAGNDEDPDSESGTGGLSIVQWGDNPDKCAIYHETGREMGFSLSHYMAHEMGHTQNIGSPLSHHCSNAGCIMLPPATGWDFCDDCKNALRESSSW